MPADNRNLLEVLQSELRFVESGHYHPSAWAYWRPQFIFEDSPTCMNFGKSESERCIGCLLLQFVPLEHRADEVPCRQIPLNSEGTNIASFYRDGTQEALESAVANWLRTTIQELEESQTGPECRNAGEVLCLPDGNKLALCEICSSVKAAGLNASRTVSGLSN